ncbi:SDR family NAD(P)-dependent oxidoreductase [Streptomyces sp. IBSBF 2435]|uniref:SDR family NAD(P)-dependent oxidoreductase n=1 Tax=Streptomyces sp. IBSBF 2435 TaxID=2903531 RepID=UPI002FDC6BE7
MYADFADVGLAYGAEFRRLVRVSTHPDGVALGVVRGPDGSEPALLHPAVLDCAMQTLAAVAPAGGTFLPVGFDEIALHKKPRGELRTVLRLSDPGDGELTADILASEGERPVFSVRGLRLRRVTNTATPRRVVHEPHWTKKSLPTAGGAAERDIVVVGAAPDRLPAAPAGVRLCFAADAAQAAVLLGEARRGTVVCWFWTPGQRPAADRSPAADVEALRAESERNYRDLLHLVSVLDSAGPGGTPRLLLVTEAAQRLPKDPVRDPADPAGLAAASLWGFGQVLFKEYPSLRVTLADLPADAGEQDLLALLDECGETGDADHRIALRAGVRHVLRLRPVAEDQGGQEANFELAITEYGQFSNVRPVPVPDRAPDGDEIEVQVHAAGVNFKDVLNVLGMLRQHAQDTGIEYVPLPLGYEASGTVLSAGPGAEFAPGDEVLFSHLGCMRRRATVSSAVAVRKPAAISFAEAAGLPAAYVTAYYALHDLAGIRPGDRVLVHAAAGGVGQAAIQLARLAGAEVYATASPRKWPLLRTQGVRHIMNSRTLDFSDQVLEATGGRGVDIVLNSLNKDHIPATVRCLGEGGRFLEIGKIGVWSPERMREARPDVDYHCFDLSELPEAELNRINKSTLETVVGLMDTGDLGPLPTVGYALDEIEEAFGVLSRGANTGKLVLEFPVPAAGPAAEPVRLSADETYLITGGLGALGLVAARRLVREGARHLALVSRRAVDGAEVARLAADLGPDVRLAVLRGDIADAGDVARILAEVEAGQAPLGGVLHAAGVLADAPVSRQTWQSLDAVLRPKMYGSWLLHRATAELPGLRFFVGYSSVASVVGYMGQSNYAAGNAFLDTLMHQRAAAKLPALSVNWGPWAEVGMAAELTAQQIRAIEVQGIRFLTPGDGTRQLVRAWDRPGAQAMVCEFDWERYLTGQAATDAFFTAVRPRTGTGGAVFDLAELLARPRTELPTAVKEVLRVLVAAVLNFELPDDVESDAKFIELGLDSLAMVELKNALESAFRTELSSSTLFDHPTVGTLSVHIAGLLAPPDDESGAPQDAGAAAPAPDPAGRTADTELTALREYTL